MRKTTILTILLLLLFSLQSVEAQNDTTSQLEDLRYEELLNSEMNKMLDLWYVKREMSNSHSILNKFSDDHAEITETTMDSIYTKRLKSLNSIVQLGYSPLVRNYINLYANKRQRSSSAILGLAQYYYPWMMEIFDKYGLPEELVYITIIESSLNPIAVSPAGATGIWQFMYQTGKTYGLEVYSFVDDRRDPVKATDAAARHLRDLYNIFGDWGLAISAYNCGAGNVKKAIYRSGGKTNFWEVKQFLPRETQNYFPAFIGAYYMMNYYKSHGITPAKISIPTSVDTVMVKKEVHFEQIAHVLDINIDEIKTLNPQYKRNVIPAFDKPFPLKLRSNDCIRFLALQDSIYKYEYDTFFGPLQVYVNAYTGKTDATGTTKKKWHTVKSGENLSKIASRYGLSVEELKKMNKLKSNYLKTGQKLIVGYIYVAPPKPATPSDTTGTAVKDSLTTSPPATTQTQTTPKPATTQQTDNSHPDYIIHTVQKGEYLALIAKKYGTTVAKIVSYNHLSNANALKVGQKLKIPKNK